MENQTGLAIFEGQEIRRTWHNDEWWFVIVDVVAVLSESKNPSGYLKDMRRRDEGLSKGWGQIATPLSVDTAGGEQKINCANFEGILRIVQSIPSQRAEPFKLWLAKVGKERVEEIENPELIIERMRENYRTLGYDDEWIRKRLQTIDIRKKLTEEWEKRGVDQGLQYSILTAEIAKHTFGLKPSEHKQHKGLKRENLRDHMTDLELIFTMLGEEGTRQEATLQDAQGFEQNRKAAREGGEAAGMAREAFEIRSGRKVLSPENRKDQIKAAKEQARLESKKKKDS